MTVSTCRSVLGGVLLACLALGQAGASTIQGYTFEKKTLQGIGTTVFLGGCCQTNTVSPSFTYAFQNVSAGTRLVSVNLPPSYLSYGTVEYSVCTNATGACHTEASYVAAPNFITQVTVPASGFVDLWWRFTPQQPSSDLADYVVLGVSAPVGPCLPAGCPSPKAAKVVLGDQTSIAEGNVGVNDYSPNLPTSLQFGNSVFMPQNSSTVAFNCTSSSATAPPPSNTSLSDLFSDPRTGNCHNFVRNNDFPWSPPILTPPPLPAMFSPGSTWTFPPSGMLDPGPYGDASVPQNATLELTGGSYEFKSLNVQSGGKLVVDTGSTINVLGALTVGEFGMFGPNKGHSLNPTAIQVNSGCGLDNSCTVVTFDRASHVAMALNAPNAMLRVNRSVRAKGRFVANYVNGDQTLLFRTTRGEATGPERQFTTLTQEEYGKPETGRANDPGSGYISQNPGVLPVTVGELGIRALTLSDKMQLECFLPATLNNPAALCAKTAVHGVNNCATSPQDMEITDTCGNVVDAKTSCGTGDTQCSGGQGGGTLTGQAIAAKLNVALSDDGVTLAGLGNFVLPTCLCTDTKAFADCQVGRRINNTAQQQQGKWAGLEDGITTVNDVIAFADQALGSDCNRSGVCTSTCSTAFAPPDPIRIGEMAWTLQSVNECFSGCVGSDCQCTGSECHCVGPACQAPTASDCDCPMTQEDACPFS